MSEAHEPTHQTEIELPGHEHILEALKVVKDPEIGINIVDLGLVYSVSCRGTEIDVEMTLTSPACPAGPQIIREATETLQAIPGVTRANVRLVMSPPWSTERMSDFARDELGIF